MYTIGDGTNAVTLNAKLNAFDITIKTATGISSVSLNGESCTSTAGCVVSGLTVGQSYVLTATLSDSAQYAFASWANSAGKGTIASSTSASTTFTVGAGATTLTPSTSLKSYLQRTYLRYENADGTWTNYDTTPVDSTNVAYGATYAYTYAATTTYQSASVTSYTVTEAHDNYLSVYRKTFTITKQYRLENADGTWGNYTADGTASVRYGGSYTYSKTVTNYKGSSSGTNGSAGSASASNVTAATTLSISMYRNTFTCSKQYRLENVDGTWGSYTADGSTTARYGGSCSYSKTVTNYKGSSSGTNGSAGSASASNVTAATTLSISMYRNTFTCSKQYRLQAADGTWGSYTADGSVTAKYGGSCSYSKTVTDYKGSSSGSNGAQGSTSASNVTAATTLSLSFYRNTYTLTVTAGTNTSSASGGGTKRWGQASTVSVTKAANVTCTTYGTPTWTQSGTAGTFSSTSGASVTFTMGKGNATVTATSAASNVAQTVTLSRGTGVSSIKIGSTNYTASSVSLNCGSYSISGNYSTNYEFSSWARSGSVTVASTSSASTTMTVSGAGTLTLNGKSSCVSVSGYMQDFTGTANYCSTTGTLTDRRDNQTYTVKLIDHSIVTSTNYKTAWWMTRNLAIGCNGSGGTYGSSTSVKSLTSTYSNVSSSWSTPTASLSSGNSKTEPRMTCSSTYGAWYNYAAASAGTVAVNYYSGSGATYNICPKGWTLPMNQNHIYPMGNLKGVATLNAVKGGFWEWSRNEQTSNGMWWGRQASGSENAVCQSYNGSSDVMSFGCNMFRYDGLYVRCLKEVEAATI